MNKQAYYYRVPSDTRQRKSVPRGNLVRQRHGQKRGVSKNGGVTIVALTDPENNTVVVGYAICSMSDPFNHRDGVALAESRAYHALEEMGTDCIQVVHGTTRAIDALVNNVFTAAERNLPDVSQ